jgi:Leucine-rich repeat (LRR) protein
MVKTFLFFAILWNILNPSYACPQLISSYCQCVDETDGVLLNCTQINADQIVQILKTSQAEVGLIKWLILQKTNIPKLSGNFFSGLYIKRLDLINNGITEIDDQAFNGLGSTLQELNIQYNNLSHIPVTALSKLNSLLRLDLTHNNLGKLEAEDALPTLTKLYDINLAYNKITDIHKNLFENNKNNLQTINIGHNQMREIPASALRGFRKLMALHLHNNKFAKLPKLSFMNLPVLSLLNLASNRLESIDRQALLNVPSLRYFYLTGNKLTTILPYQFNSFEELEMLDLSNNQIESLPKNAFSNLPKVRQIYLGENHISTIKDHAFANSSTVILILESNQIQEITANMFDGMLALQQLSLKDNQIKVVDPNAFRNISSLQMIDLSKNQLIDFAPSTFMAQMNMLLVDISQNKLIRTPYSAFSRRVATVLLQENPLVCSEKVHMLQQGLGVYVPNSEDKICAGQKSIDEVIGSHKVEDPVENVFKTDESENAPAFNPLQITPNVPTSDETMSKNIRPINIHSIPSQNGGEPTTTIIRPVNQNPMPIVPEHPAIEENNQNKNLQQSKPDINSTSTKPILPYPNDPDHPDNHPGVYYPLPVPFLKTPPKMHPAYTVTQTLPPSIVIADGSTENDDTTKEGPENTSEIKLEKFEAPTSAVFDETNLIHEGERKPYELEDQRAAQKAEQKLPIAILIACVSIVGIVMLAVFVGLCVARQRHNHFIGSAASSTTARTNAQFSAQMNAVYGTLPHQRAGTLPRLSAQEDIYNWLYGHGGCNAYPKA